MCVSAYLVVRSYVENDRKDSVWRDAIPYYFNELMNLYRSIDIVYICICLCLYIYISLAVYLVVRSYV